MAELKLKHRPMRPAWHFHSNYGSGTLSRGYTEYLMKWGGTIHEPILWLKNKGIRLKKRPVIKIKPKRLKLRSREGS